MTEAIEWRQVEDAPLRFSTCDLDGVAARTAYATLCSEDEIGRARAFRHARDADRFMVRRGWLRLALAHLTGCDASLLRFEYTAAGKPSLANDPDVRFSTSQSQGLALLVVARDREVGCDIERCDAAQAQADVADAFFSPAERTALATLLDEAWLDGFFACWTRKEAYVKALGTGLSHRMQDFTVSLAPGEPARLIDAELGWASCALPVPSGWHAAAVYAQ